MEANQPKPKRDYPALEKNKFKPGQSGNPNGKPKGAGKKDLDPLRNQIREFLSETFPQIATKFAELDNAKDMIYCWTKLADYVMPKLRTIELETDGEALPYIPLTIVRPEDIKRRG
ncbi:MAG: DUF5681 domain-containing protein [Planctomycetota bacterium]|jgi:hypothetical protein